MCPRGRQPPIRQLHTLRAPTVFKGNQSRVVAIRAAEVKFLGSVLLGILNCLPEQDWHRTHIVSTRLRPAGLIDHSVTVPQPHHRGAVPPFCLSSTLLASTATPRPHIP